METPTIDRLVQEGVELNRHYVHMMCTPSRASLQSGRLPVHVLTKLATPCDENGAIPRNMTGIAQVLRRAGYATHQVGKWDAGMVTPKHTPQGRGYDTSLNYFGHGNWGWTEAEWLGSYTNASDVPSPGIIDFWDTDKPARQLNGTGYEEYLFRDRMLQILRNHDQSKPLFLNYDSKLCHYPIQAPQEYQDRFKHITQDNRRVYHAMVAFLDDQLKNITDTMKDLGMWDNTLMVLTSDNGGYVGAMKGPCNTTSGPENPRTDWSHGTSCFNGESGANNWPLRGGKYSMFEGGIRVNAFVSGGALPTAVRGTKQEGAIHIADWYRTLAQLAGEDPTDHEAARSGLPPIDSLDVWPLISGQNETSPREEAGWLVTDSLFVQGPWKYVKGDTKMVEAAWGGPAYPNASTVTDPIDAHFMMCPSRGCLFNVVADPTEREEVGEAHPEVVARMKVELEKRAAKIWDVPHNKDPVCTATAWSRYKGFYGPWRELS